MVMMRMLVLCCKYSIQVLPHVLFILLRFP